MRKIIFVKMVASGNDFLLIENGSQPTISSRVQVLAKKICDRKFGIGADGLLLLEKSKQADIKMRVFNADGSQAKMCGNGARCVALFLNAKHRAKNARFNIETKAGIIEAEVNCDNVKIKLSDPKKLKLDIALKVNNRTLHVNFIDTGVPHTVIFVEGLDKIDVLNLGRQIRYHRRFLPAGTNVNFVEVLSKKSITIRTYERGVEDETLACGTGSVASALIFSLKAKAGNKINVHTRSGEMLKVYFDKIKNKFYDVYLEGKANIVCQGEYYV